MGGRDLEVGGSFTSFRPSFEGQRSKRSRTFLRKKVHPRQNPGYAYVPLTLSSKPFTAVEPQQIPKGNLKKMW